MYKKRYVLLNRVEIVYHYSISSYLIKYDSIKNTMKDQIITIARLLILEIKKVVSGKSEFNRDEIIQIKNTLIDISKQLNETSNPVLVLVY